MEKLASVVSLIDVSGVAGFLLGIAVGAAGTYFADKFTDRRRATEADSAERKKFNQLQKLMPDLLQEMRKDLASDDSRLITEFVVIPNRNVTFNSSRTRFYYYESEHPNLREKLDRLEQAGFILDVTPGNAPIYKFQEYFVALLQR